jgi:hypothetical protein
MKEYLILVILLISLISCESSMVEEEEVMPPLILTPFQQAMLDEINLARTNPAQYAETRLKSEMENGDDNGSFQYLKNLSPLGALTFCKSLTLSASSYSAFLSDKNLMGHDENGTPLKRAIIVGFEGSTVGENIAASSGDSFNPNLNPRIAAISFVKIMIIDERVADISHRLTILNPKYKTLGVGFSRNTASTFINYNVQDFGDK